MPYGILGKIFLIILYTFFFTQLRRIKYNKHNESHLKIVSYSLLTLCINMAYNLQNRDYEDQD